MLLSAGILLSSCAYVQTHKNVEELGSYYDGQVLSTVDTGLYRKNGAWYLSAQKARFRLRYPIVHDSVFRKNDYNPRLELLEDGAVTTVYHRISDNAANVLMRPNGYFELSALADDMRRSGGEWLSELPGAERHSIAAEIGGKKQHYIGEGKIPAEKSFLTHAIGKLDFIAIDVPLTLAYNVSIPVMAPFVFFYEFITED